MIQAFRLLSVADKLAGAQTNLMAQSPAACEPSSCAPAAGADDPHLWLEDVLGDKALAWVRERNAQSRQVLEAWPPFEATRAQLRAVLDSKEQIPGVCGAATGSGTSGATTRIRAACGVGPRSPNTASRSPHGTW
jgi:hypothetical protein